MSLTPEEKEWLSAELDRIAEIQKELIEDPDMDAEDLESSKEDFRMAESIRKKVWNL